MIAVFFVKDETCELIVWMFCREVQIPNFHDLYVSRCRSSVHEVAIVKLLITNSMGVAYFSAFAIVLTFVAHFATNSSV